MSPSDSWAYPDAWRREEAVCQALVDLRRALLLPANPEHVRRLAAAALQLLTRESVDAAGALDELQLLLSAWRLRPGALQTLHVCRHLDRLQARFELQARLFPLQEPAGPVHAVEAASAHSV